MARALIEAAPECVIFFSGKRRHTRWNCDWSSDVCSSDLSGTRGQPRGRRRKAGAARPRPRIDGPRPAARSEEHTSELQSQFHLVCRLLLEKKKKQRKIKLKNKISIQHKTYYKHSIIIHI